MIVSLLFFVILFLCFLGYYTYLNILTFRILNKIPGPSSYPVIGNLCDVLIPSENLWHTIRYWAKYYYPIFKIRNLHKFGVFLVDPDDIQIVISSTKHLGKGQIYTLLEPWLGTGLLTSTGTKWHYRRKILTPSFHFNILQHFMGIFAEQSDLLVKRLNNECNKDQTDIVPIISDFTLHSICESAMGTRLDQRIEHHASYVKAIYRMGQLIIHQLVRPWLYTYITYIVTPQAREKLSLAKYLHNFSMDVIQQRKESYSSDFVLGASDETGRKKRLAMLDLLISAQRQDQAITDEGIREEVDTFMFEGHDTTAMSISFTLMLLAIHRNIQDKVVQELNEIFGASNRSPTYDDVQNMQYLEMVLKESLRMFPSVPTITRSTDEEFTTKSGYLIPKATEILILIYDVHHNPDIYPEPYRFDPERFLPENTINRHPFAFLPFSAGPRNCIGQKFAMIELKIAVSTILRNFALEPRDTLDSVVLYTDVIIRSKHGIHLKFSQR